jgi:hypothetical protein
MEELLGGRLLGYFQQHGHQFSRSADWHCEHCHYHHEDIESRLAHFQLSGAVLLDVLPYALLHAVILSLVGLASRLGFLIQAGRALFA